MATKGEERPTFSIVGYPAKMTPINWFFLFKIGEPLEPGFVGIVYIEYPLV